MALTPAERALRSRIGALALHAQGRTNTKPGSHAFMARFEREVDPDNILTPEERARRAEYARRAYMSTLSLRGVIAKRKRRESRKGAKA